MREEGHTDHVRHQGVVSVIGWGGDRDVATPNDLGVPLQELGDVFQCSQNALNSELRN